MVRKTEKINTLYIYIYLYFVIFRQVSNHTVIKADILKLNFFSSFLCCNTTERDLDPISILSNVYLDNKNICEISVNFETSGDMKVHL